MVSLTDMWKAQGSKPSRKPTFWLRHEGAVNFMESLAKKLNLDSQSLLTIKSGRYGGGTFAHKQIAIAYAKYLSPEFHMFVNDVFMEKMEEEANPELSYEKNQSRADKAKEALVRKYQREGKLR